MEGEETCPEYLGPVERPLRSSEMLMAYMHDIDGSLVDTNVLLVGGKSLLPDIARLALEELQRREPLLRTRIVTDGEQMNFQQMKNPEIDFSIGEAKSYENWWVDEFQNDIERKLNTTDGPLWRVKIFEDSSTTTVLIFTFHHSAFDGGSIMALYNKFLTLCAEFDENNKNSSVLVSPRPGIFRNALEIWKQPISWWSGIRFLVGALFTHFRGNYAKTYSPALFQSPGLSNPETEQHTRIYPFSLEGEVLSEFKQRCKENSVTIHSAVTAASLLAYTDYYNVECTAKKILICHSVSVRRFCSPVVPKSELGCYLLPFFTISKMRNKEQRNMWELAAEIQNQTHGKNFVGILSFFMKIVFMVSSQTTRKPNAK